MGSGLNKIRNRVGFINRVYYNKFISLNPESNITYNEYISILKASTLEVQKVVITNELGFKIPNNLGYIAITKFKQKENYVVTDWVNSIKNKKFIPLINLHSFGYMFKLKLYKNNKIKPLVIYNMKAHRLLKRNLAKYIKEGKQNYLELDPTYFNKRFSITRLIKNI